MKEYKYLYQRMLDEDIIRKAYKKLRKGKTKRREIQQIDANLDAEVAKMREMIRNTRPGEVEHPELAYKPHKRTPKVIKEHGKERRIYMPEIHEQWLHHIIVLILEPIIVATAYPYSCGSFPKRGAHYGKKKIKSWMSDIKGTKYYAKLDIRHFYENIRIDVLMRELSIRIKDSWFLYIIELCLKGFKKGIPLGFYISQWLANYILEPLDKFITKTFQKYERYMDDMVIFSGNKKKLHEVIVEIAKMLGRRFRLKLKNNYQVVRFIYERPGKKIGRPLDFMGFLFFRDRITIRKKIMLSATRMATYLAKRKEQGKKWYSRKVESMVSYVGWFTCTDTYQAYLDRIKPCVDIGKLKKIISRIRRKQNHESMVTGIVCREAGGAAACSA